MTKPEKRWFFWLALLPFICASPVVAQSGTPVPGNAPIGVLGQVQVDNLPSPDAEVWFIRFFLDPGGSLPLDKQIGPTVVVVESGALDVMTDRPVDVSGSNAATPAANPGMRETTVTAGQTVYIHEDTFLAVRNNGDQRAAFLALLTFSGVREVESTETEEQAEAAGTPQAQPVGFSQQPLGVTQAQFPAGPGTVTIERVALQPGQTARTDVTSGAVAGGIERGGAKVSLDSGTCFIWPTIMRAVLDANGTGNEGQNRVENPRIRTGESAVLAADDGFGCFGGVLNWQAGSQGATVIRAVVQPLSAATPVATPAS